MTKKDNEGAKMQPMAFLWVLPKGVTTKLNSFEDFIRNQLNYSNIVITAGSCYFTSSPLYVLHAFCLKLVLVHVKG